MKPPLVLLTLAGLLLGPGRAADNTPASAPQVPALAAAVPATPAGRDFRQPVRDAIVGQKITASRAYWGAPPPVPHSIRSEQSSTSCPECHALQNRIEKRQQAIAPLPHSEFSQCLQCHVKADAKATPFRDNDFVGLDFPGKGLRAHPQAPPTIPHKLFMRENCLSCHGPTGMALVRVSHPERSQCVQCHLPEASSEYTRPVEWQKIHGQL